MEFFFEVQTARPKEIISPPPENVNGKKKNNGRAAGNCRPEWGKLALFLSVGLCRAQESHKSPVSFRVFRPTGRLLPCQGISSGLPILPPAFDEGQTDNFAYGGPGGGLMQKVCRMRVAAEPGLYRASGLPSSPRNKLGRTISTVTKNCDCQRQELSAQNGGHVGWSRLRGGRGKQSTGPSQGGPKKAAATGRFQPGAAPPELVR